MLVLAGGRAGASGEAPEHEIRLVGRRFTPPAGVPEEARREIGRRAEELRGRGHERLHLLVQLHELPSPAGRGELARRGLDLGAFVPGSAFIAAVPVGLAVAAVARPEVRWATLWTAQHKLHPRVAAGEWAPWAHDPDRPGLVSLMLLLHHDVPLAAGAELATRHGAVAMPPVEGLHGMTVWLPREKVAELAGEEEVLWIEEAPPPLSPTNDGVRAGVRSDGLAAAPYGLDGSGVRLLVFDEGTVRRTHQTFDPGSGSRVTLIDGQPVRSHSTHVAGTAAGDGSGSAGGRGRGVAPGVSILSAGYQPAGGTSFWDTAGDLEADYALARNAHAGDIGTNSLGSNTAERGFPCAIEGDYGAASNLVDGIVAGSNPAVGGPFFMTWGAGNERTGGFPFGRCGSNYRTTAPPACSKNPIQVGAVNSDGLSMTDFSSWGPCDDGRLQPTLVAPGCETGLVTGESSVHSSTATSDASYGGACGTSMATPAVAGVASLLVQDWRAQGHGGPNDRPLPALLKALLIHTARDLGPEGPDYTYGYGAVDAKAAIDLLRRESVLLSGWTTGTVGQGLVEDLSLDGPLVPLDEIKVTLVWDDPPAAPFAAEALVNDLSLEVSGTAGSHHPWVLAPASPHLPATAGIDSWNNVEQVVIRNPSTASDWLVRVAGTRVPQGPQSYALVYSFKPATGDRAACTPTTSGFELGADGWMLNDAAARTAAPAAGHGATSLRLGSRTDTLDEATRQVVVPTEARTKLSFWWYMRTDESLDDLGFGADPFTVEIRNPAGAVLAVVDLRNDGWPEDTWMPPHRIDLSSWAGQTVTVAFAASNDSANVTTFWVDDIVIESCPSFGAPMAVADAATVVESSGANVIHVLANDTDADGGPKTIQSATDPANGTAVVAGDGLSLTYAPDASYCNTNPGGTPDTFSYTLTQGGGTATVSVTVICASAAQAQTLHQTLSGCNGAAPTRTIQANPSTYRSLLAGLLPGDRLQLAAGTYTQGLNLWNKNGEPGKCIVIEGPASGSPALFTGSDNWNLVSLADSSYIALRNLTLDGLGKAGDGIKAEAGAVSVHHILIEGLSLKNFNQSRVSGINTKCPAWNWVVRHTTITSTFTGMNFGGSSGEFELTNFLVEHNLVHGTQSFNALFRHQLSRNTSIGVPTTATTIIRHNTFSKETGSLSGSQAQPNLLVGHWPLSGAGSSDIYQIYGNLFYQNPYESLFQGEGNLALHHNLLVNRTSDAVRIQPHNSVPRRIEAFNNTVVAGNNGIRITGADPAYPQRVVGNAVFAGTPLTGGQQSNNVTGTYAAASTYLNNPMATLGSGLDLHPKTGQLQGTAIDHSVFSGLLDWDRDFNNLSRTATYRGAYSGDGVNPGWTPALAIKPFLSPGNVLQNGLPVSGISGAHASQQLWTMSVPPGASNLLLQISGGTGDAELYVRFGSPPTTTTWDCRPFAGDSNETCSFPSPAVGTWHVMLIGDGAYSGVTLVGSYQGSTCSSISDVEPNDSMAAPQAISGACNQISGTFLNDATTQQHDYFRLSLPAGQTVTALLDGLSVDYDLEIYDADGDWVAYSYNGGATADQASWTNTGASAVDVYILVYRSSSTRTTYQLRVSYQVSTCNSISDVEPNNSTAAAQAISGTCNQISGSFLNDATTQQNDYFRLSLPAGQRVTALLDGLEVDYDLYIYNAAGTEVARSEAGGTTADQASWTNTGASAVNVYILVWRYSSTRTTYDLMVSY